MLFSEKDENPPWISWPVFCLLKAGKMSSCFSNQVGSKESITFSQIFLGVLFYKHLPRGEGLIS